MKRGFKSRCEQISKRYRKALGLSLQDALPYQLLADHLGVLVWTPKDVPGLDDRYIRQLTVTDQGGWSAVTVSCADRYVVILNSSHSDRRVANDVIHELAHIILNHAPSRVDISDEGHLWVSTYGKDEEGEANWLAATLLLPREGLLNSYRSLRSYEAVASEFGVSVDLVRMQINIRGINIQLRRSNS